MMQATLPGTLPLWLSVMLLAGAAVIAILGAVLLLLAAGVAGWKIWRQR